MLTGRRLTYAIIFGNLQAMHVSKKNPKKGDIQPAEQIYSLHPKTPTLFENLWVHQNDHAINSTTLLQKTHRIEPSTTLEA